MEPLDYNRMAGKNLGRLEALSDGVFAVAITVTPGAAGTAASSVPDSSGTAIRRSDRMDTSASCTSGRQRVTSSILATAPVAGYSCFHSLPGITRRMNSSNNGTVNAVSPCAALQIMPFEMSWLRSGPSPVT